MIALEDGSARAVDVSLATISTWPINRPLFVNIGLLSSSRNEEATSAGGAGEGFDSSAKAVPEVPIRTAAANATKMVHRIRAFISYLLGHFDLEVPHPHFQA